MSFIQGVRNHFVFKIQFTKLKQNNVKVNSKRNELYISSKENTGFIV